ncbi:trypsin-like serine peptidase [Streptomyces sp. NPDC020983]|uniref:trypsin-like serine peptidase n=1 Tax=Streptomyces sp. NPDC020983 TaxID=3365106 RepID=UPI0037A6D875
MPHRTLPALVSAALLCVVALLWPVHHADAPPGRPWTAQAAERFWTPERMADSMPAAGRERLPPAVRAATGPAAAEAVDSAVRFAGLPTVGVLFSVGDDLAAHRCTASVVHSPGRDLVLTAAHCRPGTDIGFVPGYRAGAARQPYGIWAVGEVFTDPRWKPDDDAASDHDVAFARVLPGPRGRRIEDVTGADRLARTPGYRIRVTVVGYPSRAGDPRDLPVTCTTGTGRLGRRRQLRIVCDGFAGGTSGGPWLLGLDPRTGTGSVVGLIGGLDGGGPDDRTSYSPFFGDAVLSLYRAATRS